MVVRHVAPLQLVVDAVSSTKDYTVFSSQLMQVLLEFKWYGFARARFFAELAFYCVHTTVVLVYNITLSASVKHNFNLPKLLLGSEPAATDAEGVPSWDNRCVIIVGWVLLQGAFNNIKLLLKRRIFRMFDKKCQTLIDLVHFQESYNHKHCL